MVGNIATDALGDERKEYYIYGRRCRFPVEDLRRQNVRN